MKIIKIFNNNIVAALSKEYGEIIVTGSGIGFQKRAGDVLDENKIEKTYLFHDKFKSRLEQTLAEVPIEYFEMADTIIKKASQELDVEFSDELFIAITDHISFAIKRFKENIILPNLLMSEIKTLYRNEYVVGLWAIDYVEKCTGIRLSDDEAGYIASHLVNFSLNYESNNAVKILSFTKDILSIIEKTMKVSLVETSNKYSRLSIHLKFLAERIFRNEEVNMEDTTDTIRSMFGINKKLELCIDRIEKRLLNLYDYQLSPDEKTYLCIHILNNTR
ncbi:MAG: PRD domain-containing protein [Erysipelotrichaceae bacterium]|nr:PRD domain-containing protein [Erysipelotrichaceae bacterium]